MLDARTLIFAVSITLVVTSITVVISGIINRNISGVREWVLGYILLALGLSLQGSQGWVDPMISVFIANLIIPSGFALLWLGFLKYKGLAVPSYALVFASIIFFITVIHAGTGVDDNAFAIRTVFMSGICGVINLLAAKALLSKNQPVTRAERMTGFILLTMGIALFVRAISTFNLPDHLILTSSNAHNYFTYTFALIFNILLSFGLVIMPSERLQNRLSQLADTDFLTGILSRRAFANYTDRLIRRVRENDGDTSLLLFDIDDFKRINDEFGHSAGDRVLQIICREIKSIIRPADLFGRIGGEEFAVLFTNLPIDKAKMVAERIRKIVEQTPIVYEGNSIRATISLGLTIITSETESFEVIYKEADRFLYDAKHEGKNRIAFALPE